MTTRSVFKFFVAILLTIRVIRDHYGEFCARPQ